ncbi:DNA repair protein rhp54 [Elysia marginata]|uniref:DNA repair protein rhp54 n=1 Tax=Elysia marginata TaxID=1093978 RepID=A0AAV4HWF0_9GAST|nr:DNA repair protein rhp54 [Elysia marginata]
MEDVTSCEDHNMKGILRNSAQESPPGERYDSDLESLLDSDADAEFHPVAAMYKLYSDMCDAKGLVKASQDKYRKVFDYDFNLGVHRPKKEQCEVCIAHKNRHGVATAEENQEYVNHINNKVTAREIKDIAKKDARQSTTTTGCAFDLQQIVLCPHGKSSSFFYKRRLGVYNLTVYDYKTCDAYCFKWPESEGRRGSNEVATCLLKYIEIQSHQGVRDITMFSDNCAGQNRNRFVAFALNFARTHFKL